MSKSRKKHATIIQARYPPRGSGAYILRMSDSDGDSQDSQYQRTSLQVFDFDQLEEKNRQEQRRKKREVAEKRKRERERKARRRNGHESDGSSDLLESPPSSPPRSPSPPVVARKAIKAVSRIKENGRANKPGSSPPTRAKKDPPSSRVSFSAGGTAEVSRGKGILRKKLPPGSDSEDDDACTARRRGAGRDGSGQKQAHKRTVTIKEAKMTKPRRSRFSQQDSDTDSDVDPEKEAALQAHFAKKNREMNRKKQEAPPQPVVETFNMNGAEHEYTKTTEEQLAERNAEGKQNAKRKPAGRGRFQEDSSSDEDDCKADIGRRIEENKKRKERERLEKERLQAEEAAKAMERSRQTHAGAGGLEGMELRIGENGEVELSDIERPGSRQGSQERGFRSTNKGRGDDCSSSVSSEQRPRRGKRDGGKKKRRNDDAIKKKYDDEAEGADDSSVSSREKVYRGEKRRAGTRRDEKAFISRRSPAVDELKTSDVGRDKRNDDDSAPQEHTPTKRRAEEPPEPESPTAMIEAAKKARCQDSEDDGLWDDTDDDVKKPADQMEVDSDDEAIKTKRGIRGQKVGNKARRKRTNAAYASSDDDDLPRRPSKDSKDASKKPAAKRRARKSKDGDSEGGAVKPKKKPGKCLYKSDSDESMNLAGSEEEARKELKPDFANPKLGPPGPLVPFILSKKWAVGDEVAVPQPPPAGEVVDPSVVSDDHDQIPASMNRYLQNYQREGVQFVYSSVVNGMGCVLGDDMGLGKVSVLVCPVMLPALH